MCVQQAKELVALYVTDPLVQQQQQLQVYLVTPQVQKLLARITAAVAHDRSPLDLFAGLEEHVTNRLTQEKFPQFLNSDHYAKLCEAIREKRDLALGEILVNARRTRFLEMFLQRSHPRLVGNLLFWVDVQTIFLPLIQANMFSVALFEEIQATVRKLFNVYLTETSPSAASLISDAMRKDTLKRIMVLQGEPFSPPRYASIFRAAQDQVWEWLQTEVYPQFRLSQHYVLLVVEIENLESDHQLRRLSEQMQPRSTHSTAQTKKKHEPNSSAIIVPVVQDSNTNSGRTTQQWLRRASRQTTHGDTVRYKRVVQVEALDERVGFANVCFHSLEENETASKLSPAADQSTTGNYAISYDLFCGSHGSSLDTESVDHLVSWKHAGKKCSFVLHVAVFFSAGRELVLS